MAERHARFSMFELLLLATFAVLIVTANLALHLPLKLPGHSGVVWMAVLVIARAAIRRFPAATLVGVFSGLLAAVLSLGDRGPIDALASYTAAGLAVDVVMALAGPHAIACVLAGAAGNVGKLATKALLDVWLGIPAGFVAFGRGLPAATHLIFGAAGGYLGYLTIAALRRAGYFAYLAERR